MSHFSIPRRQFLNTLTTAGLAGGAALATHPGSRVRAQEPASEPLTWTLIHVWADRSPFKVYVETLAEQINLQSQGQLTLRLTTPTDARDTLTQVQEGRAEMGHGMPSLWEAQLPAATYIMGIPFGLTASEQNLWLDQGGGQAIADRVYGTMGCKYLPGGNLGFQGGTWSRSPITNISSLAGLTIHSSGLAANLWQSLGLNVVTLNPSQIQPQLQQGDLDAAEHLGPQQDMALELYQSAPYYYWPGWQRPGTLLDLFINQDAWQSLSPALQAVINNTVLAVNQRFLHQQIYNDQQVLQTLQSQGTVNVLEFPEAVLLRLETLMGNLLQEKSTADPLVADVVDSLITFRAKLLPWVQRVTLDYLSARRWSWTIN